MFLPYRDENPTRRFAAVTFLLIAANVLFFIYQVTGPAGPAESASQYGLIPSELSGGRNLPDSGWISPYLSLLTYMFCHGSVSHLLFNMLFLWIFGNNVEDRMGRPGYALFYAVTGVISALAFVAYKPSIDTPLVGASGAVSGILGAYLFLFPTARVYVWMVLFVLRMPALVFLPLWFLLQIFGFMNDTSTETGNVAWISHIAGFLAGVLLFKFFAGRRPD
jgi:membrane associated rhomboid family serine protease